MITIKAISAEETYSLRHSVLWPDKPFDYVKVENDAEGQHFGAFAGHELVAVISLFINEKGEARFRKFATHPDYQRQGIGTKLMNHIIAEAKKRNATLLWCDARLDASEFYRRFSMEPISELFYKGPIPYVRFSCTL